KISCLQLSSQQLTMNLTTNIRSIGIECRDSSHLVFNANVLDKIESFYLTLHDDKPIKSQLLLQKITHLHDVKKITFQKVVMPNLVFRKNCCCKKNIMALTKNSPLIENIALSQL